MRRGSDVYCFLIGITGLAAFAAAEGVFDWLAQLAVRAARGSRARLFTIVFGIGVLTTALLSNDATIVVLTPAVIAAVARLDVDPIPYVLACAFIANAASFLLPISNPSNLLVFGRMPSLAHWTTALALPSLGAIALTYLCLRLGFHRSLRGSASATALPPDRPPRAAAVWVLVTAAASLMIVSAFGGPLGVATLGVWLASLALAAAGGRARDVLRGVAWPVIPLTASLFVIVAAGEAHGLAALTQRLARGAGSLPHPFDVVLTGGLCAAAANLANNLPVALVAGQTLTAIAIPTRLAWATLIGVNVGPNATVFGSLATILWLGILKRAGISMNMWRFALIGTVITIPTLVLALLLIGN